MDAGFAPAAVAARDGACHQLACALSRDVPADRLRRACAGVFARHDALRTRPGEATPFEWRHEAVRDAGQAATLMRTERLREWGPADAARLRACMLVPDAGEPLLVLTAARSVADLASLHILAGEIGRSLSGQPMGAAKRFADYAGWQRDILDDPPAGEGPYWRGFPADLPGPQWPGSPSDPDGEPVGWCLFSLDDAVACRLDAFAAGRGLTVRGVVGACWQVLLERLLRMASCQLAWAADGRSFAAVEGCVGPMTKVMPLQPEHLARFDLPAAARRVEDSLALAEAWQDGFDPRRWPGPSERHGVFGLSFHTVQLAGHGVKAVRHITGAECPGDAALHVTWDPARPTGLGAISYRSGTVDGQVAHRFALLLPAVISAWLQAPSTPGGGITPWQGLVLRDPAVADDGLFLAGFDAVSRRAPDRIAVEADGEAVSYGTLDAAAERLACCLADAGLTPGGIVAVRLPRSVDLLAAMLAVLKAGGAYLMLEPQYPAHYARQLMTDCGARLLIAADNSGDDLPGVRIVARAAAGEGRLPRRHVDVAAAPGLAACIVYTSGSTGQPKGVVVSHGALSRYIGWAARRYGLDDEAGCLVHTSASVDLTVTALLAPLAAGGRVILLPERDESLALTTFLQSGRCCRLLKLTPSHLVLLERLVSGTAVARQVGQLVIGGEQLSGHLVAPWVQPSGPAIYNEYGPTEATVACCLHRAGPLGEPVAIGRPICGASLSLRDGSLQAVPAGFVGQLCIGGPGLADGYLGKPGSTAASFVPDPSGGPPGARMYLTGDLACAGESGDLVCLGREDGQVKVAGHRVDLGHVEAVLRCHGEVVQAVAGLLPAEQRHPVAAWFVAQPGSDPVATLRAFCTERLPRPLVPSHFIRVDAIPLTPGGKLDRRKLAAQAPARLHRGPAAEPPQTRTERALAGIWSRVLGVDDIGRTDNFFDLGGHSILAINILFGLRDALGVEVPLAAVFANPTVASLAGFIEAEGLQGRAETLPRLTHDAAARFDAFPMTEVQQAYWIGQTDAYALGNVGAHAYQEVEFDNLDVTLLQSAFQRLVERHDMMRMVTLPEGVQKVLAEVPPYHIAIHDLRSLDSEAQDAAVGALRQRMSHQRFSVERWPLFEVSGCRLSETRVRLHLSFDALLADAWSFEVLLRDFTRFYREPEVVLPPLEVTFRDYVMAVLGSRESDVYRRAREYWMARLDDFADAPALPTVVKLESLAEPRFVRRRHCMDSGKWGAIKRRATIEGLTLSAVTLTAFAMVLARWSQSQRFTIVLTVFERPRLHPQIDELAGDFTSLLLLDFEPFAGSFAEGAHRVQRKLLAALQHRAFGGVQLLRELARRRGDRRPPAMPIVFTSTLTQEARAEANFLAAQQVDSLGINQTPQVYLDHQVTEVDGELRFNWDAVDALFPAKMLDDMFEVYCGLLDALAAGEADRWEAPASLHIPGLHARYAELNATAAAIPDDTAIGRFMAHARWHGADTAVVAGGKVAGYGELAREASRLGRWLLANGAAGDQPVAVLLPAGLKQVVTVLGIQIAGAPYLPIDPALPPARIAALLRGASVRHLVTTRAAAAPLALPPDLIRLHWDDEVPLDGESGLLVPRARPHDLAYVMFTSGSTGQPKAVAIEHRSLINRMHDMVARLGIGRADRAIAITALHHDLSVFDMFGMFCAGGSLVVPAESETREPAAWWRLLREEKVTVWNSVPAFMQRLLTVPGGYGAPDLRHVLLSGDRVTRDLVRHAASRFPQARLISLGGPTETTVWDIWHPIDDAGVQDGPVPYGRPLANAQYWVMNENLEPCPAGVIGELCIAGAGLARTYLNDPALTNDRFVTPATLEQRVYRSGDLGKLTPGGEIEIAGRMDLQVKLRGQRIELEEIEAVLRRHPEVRDVAAGLVPGGRAEPALVAWVELGQAGFAALEPVAPAEAAEADDYGVASEGMLHDPVERIEFKLQERNIRVLDGHRLEPLPRPELSAESMARRSERRFGSEPVGAAALGGLLSSLVQMRPSGFALPKYRYPSAGNAYPVQAYVLIRPGRINGLPPGAYYYDPRQHGLVELDRSGDWPDSIHPPNNRAVSLGAAFSIFLVVDMSAMRPLYGRSSRDFSLLEAGYIGQLLMERAARLGLGLCPLGSLAFDELARRLRLGSEHELLHGFLGGVRPEEDAAAGPSDRGKRAADWQGRRGELLASLRDFALDNLPPGMVPAEFMLLAELPRTSSGKLARAALPELGDARTASAGSAVVEPQTPLQEALMVLWRQLLGVKSFGIHDDFFRLGGDSILAIQLMNRLQETFQIRLSLRTLLRATTLAELAALIEREAAGVA